MNIRKVVLTSFTIFTLATSIILLYSAYLFIGISMSVRVVSVSISNVSVQNINATLVNVQTVITIKNPSEFYFGAKVITAYLSFSNVPVGKTEGYTSRYNTPFPIEPFGEKNVTMAMPNVQLPVNYSVSLKWGVSGLIVFETSLPNLVRVRFDGVYPS